MSALDDIIKKKAHEIYVDSVRRKIHKMIKEQSKSAVSHKLPDEVLRNFKDYYFGGEFYKFVIEENENARLRGKAQQKNTKPSA